MPLRPAPPLRAEATPAPRPKRAPVIPSSHSARVATKNSSRPPARKQERKCAKEAAGAARGTRPQRRSDASSLWPPPLSGRSRLQILASHNYINSHSLRDLPVGRTVRSPTIKIDYQQSVIAMVGVRLINRKQSGVKYEYHLQAQSGRYPLCPLALSAPSHPFLRVALRPLRAAPSARASGVHGLRIR